MQACVTRLRVVELGVGCDIAGVTALSDMALQLSRTGRSASSKSWFWIGLSCCASRVGGCGR